MSEEITGLAMDRERLALIKTSVEAVANCPPDLKHSATDNQLRRWIVEEYAPELLREVERLRGIPASLGLLQSEVGIWQRDTFINTSEGLLTHLGREIDELEKGPTAEELADCLILLCGYAELNGVLLRTTKAAEHAAIIRRLRDVVAELNWRVGTVPNIRDMSLSNIMVLLFTIAGMNSIDLLSAAMAKLEINKTRTWSDPDEQGVIEHRRDGKPA